MMHYLRRRRLKQEISVLRHQIARTDRERSPLALARLCHHLAQLSIQDGRRREAVRWFGQSIDAYVYAGFIDAAAAMCSKLIQFEPRVIRARATLAMLCLASGKNAEAAEEIQGYVDATRRQRERSEITHERLRVLASLADDLGVRILIGQSLLELGAEEAGKDVLRRVQLEQSGEPPARISEHERWKRLLDAALQAPENVKGLD